jgi:hypothetical protein
MTTLISLIKPNDKSNQLMALSAFVDRVFDKTSTSHPMVDFIVLIIQTTVQSIQNHSMAFNALIVHQIIPFLQMIVWVMVCVYVQNTTFWSKE